MTNDEMIEAGISACAYRFESHPTLRVEWRGTGMWAVVDLGICLNHDNDWETEPMPSSRTEEFFARCRFSLDEALRRALDYISEWEKERNDIAARKV